MTQAFRLVGFMFLVAGVLWLMGMRFLKRDTELAPTRIGPASTQTPETISTQS